MLPELDKSCFLGPQFIAGGGLVMILGECWMEVQVRSLLLDVALDMAGKSRCGLVWKSSCGGASCFLYSGCLLPQPSVPCSWPISQCGGRWVGGGGTHHHSHTFPAPPSSLLLAAKTTASPSIPERPGRQTCGGGGGGSFQHQLVHKMPFWCLGLVMCLWGYLLLGNCQLKFEPDLGLAVNCPG